VLVSSAVLATAFVFGTTAATMFRALLMIFYTNPFGVGDWIRVDGEILQVRELGLSFFVVVNFWGEVIFLPVSTVLGRADLQPVTIAAAVDEHDVQRGPRGDAGGHRQRAERDGCEFTFIISYLISVRSGNWTDVVFCLQAHIDSDPANYT
jgi:hypothetical protein